MMAHRFSANFFAVLAGVVVVCGSENQMKSHLHSALVSAHLDGKPMPEEGMSLIELRGSLSRSLERLVPHEERSTQHTAIAARGQKARRLLQRKASTGAGEESAKQSPQTTWHCVGEDDKNRHCIFKNLYYGRASNGRPDFQMLLTKDQDPRDTTLLRADKYEGLYQPRIHYFDSVKDIEKHLASKPLLEEPDLSVQFNPLFHQNIGHAIFDGLYPAYLSLIALGQSDRKFRPVVAVDPGCFDGPAEGRPLEPGDIVETYVWNAVPGQGRSLRAVRAKVVHSHKVETRRQCSFKQGLDRHGLDLGSKAVGSQNECCEACQTLFGCEAAVMFSNICYFKGKCENGGNCAYARDSERTLCALEGEAPEGRITVLPVSLAAVNSSEVTVPDSWVLGRVRQRCMSEGVFETFGRMNEMRRLFEMERDSAFHPNLLVRFEEIIMGVGGAGNLIMDSSGAIGGSTRFGHEAMSHFRDRMYASYGIPVNSKKPGPNDKLNVIVVSNKRFNSEDRNAIQLALKDVNANGGDGQIINWGAIGQPDTRFHDHLKRVSEADVYVSSIGTALQYVPFMRDGRVYIALGSIWQRSKRLFPTFMEQQLAGGGTPYLRTLYADPGSALRFQKPKTDGAMLMDLGEDGYRANVNGTLLVELTRQAQQLVREGFKMPVPAEENLSKEGRLMVELCKRDPQTCTAMQADRNGANYACGVVLWNECVVYEVGPWADSNHGGQCRVNHKILRQLRKEYGLYSYGAPEI